MATLKAATGQPGVKLSIDGREVGLLPREVSGLTPGEHLVSFEGDRYASTKKALIFGPNEVKQLDPEPLKVVRGAATFDVKTEGATLVLVTADERRELSDYSLPIEVDATKSWTLEASKPGYETLRVPVNFRDQPTKTFTVRLGESSKAPPEPPKAAAPVPPPEPAKVAESTPATHKVSSPEVPKAEPPKPRSSVRRHLQAQYQFNSGIQDPARRETDWPHAEGGRGGSGRIAHRALRRRERPQVGVFNLSGRRDEGRFDASLSRLQLFRRLTPEFC